MIAAGLRAAAYAPIHGRDGLIGVLIMGTSSAAVAERIGDAFPAVISFGAIAGALLGRDDERRHLESKRRAEIESIIATGAFEPVFQPIVELASRRIVGYEALSRFADGRSPAARFADAAACGLGPALELACLRKALTQARSLARGAWLSVNASPALLVSEEADLAGLVGSTRRKLVLEITEQSAVDDYVALRLALAPFKPHIRVAVDDAGAGHAGLHRILELRADIVKLDRALIRGLDADPARQALVTGMAHFAKQTNAQLLGEGIETGAEALALRELGVPLGQGFLFGRPQRIQPDLVTSKAFPGRPHPAKIHQLRVSAQRIR
jgi:EAL domain-containing protein (putative c-di-GMP-specific phosphodiesterase class I)